MRTVASAACAAGAFAHATITPTATIAAQRARTPNLILPRSKAHEYSLRPPMPSRLLISCCLASLAFTAGGCVLITADLNPFAQRPQPLEEITISGSGNKKVLLIAISGVISSEERGDSFGLRREESTVARVEEELDAAADDDDVVAIVVRINSPGGTVTASDI